MFRLFQFLMASDSYEKGRSDERNERETWEKKEGSLLKRIAEKRVQRDEERMRKISDYHSMPEVN